MLYVALGDSITAGELASAPHLAYPNRVVTMLGRRVHGAGGGFERASGEVLAQPGWTSEALMSAVLNNSPEVLQRASAVSIWIGGDNLIQAGLSLAQGMPTTMLKRSLASYGVSLHALIRLVRRFCSGKVVVCTQYNPFPNSPIAVQGIAALNEVTVSTAAKSGVLIAPVHRWFVGHEAQWIAGYKSGRIGDVRRSHVAPVHPNNRGHLAIAQCLVPYVANR